MMKNRILTAGLAFAALTLVAQAQTVALPHLEKRGAATQLIVDGKPFLVLSGELANTASSNSEYMKVVWPTLANKAHLNTVLTGVSWDWIEPEEGKYDFHFVDEAIENAQRYNVRIVWIYFASWKNGISSFAPVWVKTNQERFPRVQVRGGKTIEVLSTLSDNNVQADMRVFAALMRHVREVDKTHRTVMVQVENEVGVLGDSRDRSPLAEAAFAKPVPKALMDYLQKHKDTLLPEFRKVWEDAGFKTSGTWEEVFGNGPGKADEIFMGWNYSSYINKVVEAGKKEYPIPMFVNAWIVQPEDKGPGDYPSGGPQDHMHDIWRAGAPALDMLCPDVYLPNFNELVDRYSRSGNPLYIPESAGDLRGAGNLFYAIGQRHAIGYSQFGIDSIARAAAGPNPARPGAPQQEVEAMPLSVAYDMLGQLAPLILEHQSKDTIASVVVNAQKPDQQIKLGNYTLNVGLPRNRRNPTAIPDTTGYGIFMLTGPDEYLMAGNNVQVTFTPDGPGFASIARQEAGHFVNGKWVLTRYLAGDDSLLRYDLGAAADAGLSGTGVRLSPGERGIQKVRVYRYR